MQNTDIEELVAARIHEAVESAVEQCLREINADGHEFRPDPGAIFEWFDSPSRTRLAVLCSLGVSVESVEEGPAAVDEAVERYLELAASGTDPIATALNQLEGDIANGGFSLLFHNNDKSFIREAVDHLHTIGARRSAALVERALEMIDARSAVIEEYHRLAVDLGELDDQFFAPGESIPKHVLRFRDSAES